jgi:hypothetical protein
VENILHLAGKKSFDRGRAYHASGLVDQLVLHEGTLSARVRGSEIYTVRLVEKKQTLAHHCTCPVGVDGIFCKHGVAVALAWLESADEAMSPSAMPNASPASPQTISSPGPSVIRLDDLRPWLLSQSIEHLAGLVLEAAGRDERFREKLLREAARASAKTINFDAYRKAIDRATRTRGFVDYHEASGFAESIDVAVAPLRELLEEDPAQAPAVIELTEHAIERVEKALGEADDSDGEIHATLSDLQSLHHDACVVARPDPEALAARLFAWELRTAWDTFFNASTTYADVLGSAGLAAYRRLAQDAWDKLPPLPPGSTRSYDGPRLRLTSIMEALARADGDVDALAAIKARDLSHAYAFLSIAELYAAADRHDDALAWTERGRAAFPRETDPRLLDFLAGQYHRRARHDEAMALIWSLFEARPFLDNYQLLITHAERASARAAWRERALAHLHTLLARHDATRTARAANVWSWQSANPASTLVEIHLHEKTPDAAWEIARSRELSSDLWLRLAASREADHPLDVIPLYLREAQTLIARTGRTAYEAAIPLVKKVKALHQRLGQPDAWTAQLAALRAQHKAKRSFLLLLDRL